MSLSEEQKAKIKADQERIAASKKVKEVVKPGRVFTEVGSSGAGAFDFDPETTMEFIPPLSVEDAVARHNHDQNINGPDNANSLMSAKVVTKKEFLEQYPEEVGKVFSEEEDHGGMGLVDAVIEYRKNNPELFTVEVCSFKPLSESARKMIVDARKCSQAQMAKDVGISIVHYLNIEKGKVNVSFEILKKICDVLGLKINISK